MPELERQQRQNPVASLRNSEFWDPRLVPEAEIVDPDVLPGGIPLLQKLLRFRPTRVEVFLPDANPAKAEMPIRYEVFAQLKSNDLERCIKATLPKGFVAVRES